MSPNMGWCHEFGPQIAESCEHPMTAHTDHCECTVCGTVCTGRFAGCGAVWARGPREVAVNAPHIGRVDTGGDAFSAKAETDRWRVPLETAATATRPTYSMPTESTRPAAVPVSQPAPLHPAPSLARAFESEAEPEPETEHETESEATSAGPVSTLEPPDVTARYAVAQLQELNERVENLTGDLVSRTEAALAKVTGELEQLRTQREIDLTEQAAGIFGAVQTGADALTEFTKRVAEVSDDLRSILTDALKSIGGTSGLAEQVAASAAELNETREEFAASLGRIERDITLLRRRANAEAKEAKSPKPVRLDDEQVHYIVDAVTDAVLAAQEQSGRKKR
jgi:hypothetical protein